jgi:hypothetical protein
MSEIAGSGQIVELHGWDSRAGAWYGPNELTFTLRGCRHILSQLRELPGSWYGKLRTETPEEPQLGFHASIHDLGDAGLALLDIEGSPGGPLEVILAIPARRRAKIRPEMAFEFVAFLGFLKGLESPGSEMAVHDYIQRVLGEAAKPSTLVFSIETRFVVPESRMSICEQAERLAMSMIAWMSEKDARPALTDGSVCPT